MIILLTTVLLMTGGIRVDSTPAPPYIPDYLPDTALFDDCVSDYKPFKHKCIRVKEYSSISDYLNDCLYGESTYVDLIESDEERQFFFDEIFGGKENYVYQFAAGSPSTVGSYYDYEGISTPTDISYLASKIISYGAGTTQFNCTITADDMSCVVRTALPSAYGACTYAREAYKVDLHPCDVIIKKKFRRDSPRTITFKNDETDVCYVDIKGRKTMKPSMIKIYSYASMCPTGFLVSSNTKLNIDATKLPPLKCGKKTGHGKVIMKKVSGKGKELRIYAVLNGDGMPMKIRTKGKAYIG